MSGHLDADLERKFHCLLEQLGNQLTFSIKYKHSECSFARHLFSKLEHMSPTTTFISELIRAANQTDDLTFWEVRRLLERAISAIESLREEAGIIPIRGRDAIIYIRTVAAGADRISREEWHHGLLHAAEMIRDLHIILHTGTEITMST